MLFSNDNVSRYNYKCMQTLDKNFVKFFVWLVILKCTIIAPEAHLTARCLLPMVTWLFSRRVNGMACTLDGGSMVGSVLARLVG